MAPGQRKDRSPSSRAPPQIQRPKGSRRTSSNVQRTEVLINVYDLLPIGRRGAHDLVTADKVFVARAASLYAVILWKLPPSYRRCHQKPE